MSPQVRLYDATLTEGLWEQGVELPPERRRALADQLRQASVDFVEIALIDVRNGRPKFYQALEQPPADEHTRWSAQVRVASTRPPETEALWSQLQGQPVSVVLLSLRLDAHSQPARHALAGLLERVRAAGWTPIVRFENFFQAFRDAPEQVWPTLKTFWEAARPIFTLGDALGRALPWEVAVATHEVHRRFPQADLGFWMANHNACADDNALSAVEQGVTLVHGTLHGYGAGRGYTDLACIGTALWRQQRRPVSPQHLERMWDGSETLHHWLYAPAERSTVP